MSSLEWGFPRGFYPLRRRVEVCENCGFLVSDKNKPKGPGRYIRGHVHYYACDRYGLVHFGLVCLPCLVHLDHTDQTWFVEEMNRLAPYIHGWPDGKHVNRNLGVGILEVAMERGTPNMQHIAEEIWERIIEWSKLQGFDIISGLLYADRCGLSHSSSGWELRLVD